MTSLELINLLDKTDKTILRCFESDVAVPVEWKTYRAAIRSLISSGGGTPPVQPPYPEGT